MVGEGSKYPTRPSYLQPCPSPTASAAPAASPFLWRSPSPSGRGGTQTTRGCSTCWRGRRARRWGCSCRPGTPGDSNTGRPPGGSSRTPGWTISRCVSAAMLPPGEPKAVRFRGDTSNCACRLTTAAISISDDVLYACPPLHIVLHQATRQTPHTTLHTTHKTGGRLPPDQRHPEVARPIQGIA